MTQKEFPLFVDKDGHTLDWVLDQMGDAVCVSDKDMVFTGANKRFAQFYGFAKPQDVIGKSSFDVYPDFEKSVFYEACRYTVDTGEPASRVGYSANLKKWIVLRSYQIADNRYAMIVHVVADSVGRSGVVAHIDDLTSLPNRVAFEHDVEGIFRHGTQQAVALIDIGHFKHFNETLGFEQGDRCLMEVAARLKAALLGTSQAYRVGNDRFLVLCASGMDDLRRNLEDIKRVLVEPMRFKDLDIVLGFHVGLACTDMNDEGGDMLLKKAEIALSEAKTRRLEQFEYQEGQSSLYDPVQVKTLLDAMEQGQMVLFYQPQMDMIDGSMVGAEALIRWDHPLRGLLPPSEFLPLVQEANLEQHLDQIVLGLAFDTLSKWKKQGVPLALSVNLSAPSVADAKTLDMIAQRLEESNITPSQLCIEITEGSLIQDVHASQTVIEGLKALGVEIALDDFGTGYCSMSYLLRYPSHFLKIDRSFVQDLDTQPTKQVTTRNIISLAHGLGILVVAEGVERKEELDVLQEMGCNISQGYYHAKPMAEDSLMAWMKNNPLSPLSSFIR